MPVTTIQPASTNPRPTIALQQDTDSSFKALLDCHQGSIPSPSVARAGHPRGIDAAPTPTAPPEPEKALIRLGEINQATPSVSHLLLRHHSFRQECWNIVFAEVNQGKPFTSIRPGQVVSLNPATKELAWGEPAPPSSPITTAGEALPAQNSREGHVPLGTISADTPTVSHLLTSSSRYREQTWGIIFSEANRNKPYASLHPGSLVSINPQTLELLFTENKALPPDPVSIVAVDKANPAPLAVHLPDDDQKSFASRLAASVKSYLGQPYQEIDCYDLVVRGLKDQGVQYDGSGGLFQHLEQLATGHGLPANAYLNGEGLIEAAGNRVYAESFPRIKSAERKTDEVLDRLKPLLHEGMLLSFSTPTRGHTGVIAKKDGQWTYVNSGMIDHQVNGGKISRRVGEETLADEIRNWFVLAKKDSTSLKVSAGMFDTKKLQATGGMVAKNKSGDRELI